MDYDLDESARILGWSETTWDDKDATPPAADQLNWDELSDTQKDAADDFCYFFELWDRKPVDIWRQGASWPEWRYYLWSDLGSDSHALLTDAGYSEDTWNQPGSADFEHWSWSDLSDTRRDLLVEYGFYQAQWDCYISHYSAYDWFELVLVGVAEHFETLGWTEDTWDSGTEPDISGRDWDDLSEVEQDAAKSLCYFRENWDDLTLIEWDDSDRSGSIWISSSDSESDDEEDYYEDEEDEDEDEDEEDEDNFAQENFAKEDKSGPSAWAIIIVVLIALVVGFFTGVFTAKRKEAGDDRSKQTNPEDSSYEMEFQNSSISGKNDQDFQVKESTHNAEGDVDAKDVKAKEVEPYFV